MAKFESFGKKRLADVIGNQHTKPVEFRCYCCKDGGTIPAVVVQEYLQDSYTFQDVPFVCRNYGCNAVDERFSGAALESMDQRATPELCSRIHAAEKEKHESLKSLESEMTNEERATWIRCMIRGIG